MFTLQHDEGAQTYLVTVSTAFKSMCVTKVLKISSSTLRNWQPNLGMQKLPRSCTELTVYVQDETLLKNAGYDGMRHKEQCTNVRRNMLTAH